MCDGCMASNPCSKGNADVGPNTFINFNDDAPWKNTLVSHEEYMEQEVPSAFSCIPGWRLEMVFRDFAHMDLLGYGRDLGGALIKTMVHRNELKPGGELDWQLRELWGEFQKDRKIEGRLK